MQLQDYPKSKMVNFFNDHGHCALRAYAYICDRYGNKEVMPTDIGYDNGYEEFVFDWADFYEDNDIDEDQVDDPNVLQWADEAYYYNFQVHVSEWVHQCLTRFSKQTWEVKDIRDDELELEDIVDKYKDQFFVALVQCPDLAVYDPYLWHVNVINNNVCYEKMDSDHADTYKSVDFIFFPKGE